MTTDEPHHGCPNCGSPDFSSTRSITSYGTEVVYCTFTTTEPNELPDYEVEDVGDSDYNDSESGDMDDNKTCLDCSHDYTEPVFHGPTNTIEDIAERSQLPVDKIKKLSWLFDTIQHARTVTVTEEPHATVVQVEPREVRRGHSPRHSWVVYACPRCDGEMEEARYRTRQACQFVADSRERLFDRRQLPVVVRAALCRQCL